MQLPEVSNTDRDIITKKFDIAKKRSSFFNESSRTLKCMYHQLPVVFHFDDELFEKEVSDYIPNSWRQESFIEEPINIYFKNSLLIWKEKESWDAISSPDCFIERDGENIYAVQRDFVGIEHNQNNITIYCHPDLDDGFFNALRWVLPKRILTRNRFVLHSSCVVDDDGMAYLFLGPSGAGKSTIASLSTRYTVFGDDMNIITQIKDGLLVEPAAIGQAIKCDQHFGKTYPVLGFFWLNQDTKFELSELKSPGVKLLSSLCNIFWENNLTEKERDNVFNFTAHAVKNCPFYQLSFLKNEKVWEFLNERKEIQENKRSFLARNGRQRNVDIH